MAYRTRVTYTLTCSKCGQAFYSSDAFPSPRLCPGCSEPKPDESKLLTDNELDDIGYPILPIGDRASSKKVSQAQDAKTASIKEAELKRLKEDHQIELQMQSDDLNDRYRIRVEEIIRDLKAILRDADDLRTLERALGDYVQALKEKEAFYL